MHYHFLKPEGKKDHRAVESQMPSSLFSLPPTTPSPTRVSEDIAAFAQALWFRNSPYPYSRHPYKPLPPSPSLLPPSLPLSPGAVASCDGATYAFGGHNPEGSWDNNVYSLNYSEQSICVTVYMCVCLSVSVSLSVCLSV